MEEKLLSAEDVCDYIGNRNRGGNVNPSVIPAVKYGEVIMKVKGRGEKKCMI
ncbi:MAG: hypothetical protein PVJ20_09625 [Desulfobacterales bacterium]|jgi:hypothetical protein